MTDLTTLTQNDLASLGASVFAELNRRTAEHNRKMIAARRMGMGWITPAQIDDAPLMELLDAVVSWDDDAKGTLEELRFQNSADDCFGCNYDRHRVRMSDVEFDYAAAIGAI